MLSKKLMQLVLAVLLLPALAFAQSTTSSLSGTVKTNTGETLVGATVTATHEPTGTIYRVQSRTSGRFDISNMNPGGPYTVEVTFVNFANEKRSDIYLSLGESFKIDFAMANKANNLGNVQVNAVKKTTEVSGKGGTETLIDREKMTNLPTVGRNLQDFLRAVPQARITTSEGGVSIAGQNNRFNAFYVDGAVNNDVFGLSASGTNGGRAGLPPISIDAIDQMQVVISPYDASLGNFTGGGINAITKQGTNKIKGSLYYVIANEKLTGKTPNGDKAAATRFAEFNNKTSGFTLGGPIVKNKLFFFINAETQKNAAPQPFNTATYLGSSSIAQINALAQTLKGAPYNYDPGDFIDNADTREATRIATRFDWNINAKHKLTVSYRYSELIRNNPARSTASTINFYNNGELFPSVQNSASLELKSVVSKTISNNLLISFTGVNDDRKPLGSIFPRVSIRDGSANIIFGSENSSTQNLLKSDNWLVRDIVRLNAGKHQLSAGVEWEFNDITNIFIQNTFGNYQFASINAFLTGAPTQYTLGYSLVDNVKDDKTTAGALFKFGRGTAFINDEYRASDKLTLNFGIRADYYKMLSNPKADPYANTVALPVMAQLYDLRGAQSGLKPNIPMVISPRIGFTYKIPEEGLVIRGGTGIFAGRMPLVWPGGIFNNNGINQASFTVSSSQNSTSLPLITGFKADPNNQWTAAQLGITTTPKGSLNLTSETLKLPTVWRSSIAADKKLGNGWSSIFEITLTKNISEIDYVNLNLSAPIGRSVGPDSRLVYATGGTLGNRVNIPGGNPYTDVILLTNTPSTKDKGFAYNFVASLTKRTNTGFTFDVNYAFGNSLIMNEGTSSVNYSQWRFTETVNGRNNINRNISDFSQGHRIFAYLSKKFSYAKNKLATTVSLTYTGQSGSPVSYVYAGSAMVRDADPSGGLTNDLIYVPTSSDLAGMTFLSNTVNGVTFTPDQQKAALNTFIQNDGYLKTRRGQFAERNGGRTPFTNILDFRIAQDFNIKLGKDRVQFQLVYQIANVGNLINRNWGRNYFAANDQVGLVTFVGYASTTNLTPQYRFNPAFNTNGAFNVSDSPVPNYGSRWFSQLEFRLNLF
jgi:hypothetical protein